MRAKRPENAFDRQDDELLTALRAAWRPEPLPAELLRRVRADLGRRRVPTRRTGLPPASLFGLAAAACLLIAVMVPPERPALLFIEDSCEVVGRFVISGVASKRKALFGDAESITAC